MADNDSVPASPLELLLPPDDEPPELPEPPELLLPPLELLLDDSPLELLLLEPPELLVESAGSSSELQATEARKRTNGNPSAAKGGEFHGRSIARNDRETNGATTRATWTDAPSFRSASRRWVPAAGRSNDASGTSLRSARPDFGGFGYLINVVYTDADGDAPGLSVLSETGGFVHFGNARTPGRHAVRPSPRLDHARQRAARHADPAAFSGPRLRRRDDLEVCVSPSVHRVLISGRGSRAAPDLFAHRLGLSSGGRVLTAGFLAPA